ncbi:hypothetical protein FW789_06305 [Pseudomonas sp. 1121_17]
MPKPSAEPFSALRALDYNVTRTAAALGITRPTLCKKLK